MALVPWPLGFFSERLVYLFFLPLPSAGAAPGCGAGAAISAAGGCGAVTELVAAGSGAIAGAVGGAMEAGVATPARGKRCMRRNAWCGARCNAQCNASGTLGGRS